MNGVFKKPQNAGRGVRLINVYDLYGDTTVDLNRVDRLEISKSEIENFRVAAGDIFFTRSSLKPEGVAWSAYLEDGVNSEAVFECHVIRARVDPSRAIPGFISNFARTSLGRAYLISRASVTTMATIDQQGIADLPVILPNPSRQNELLASLDTARMNHKQRLQEADDLLAGLDRLVLDSLGITLLSNDPNGSTYAVKASEVRSTGKLYPDYFHPERVNAIRSVHSKYAGDRATTLAGVSDFVRCQRAVTPDDDYLGLASIQPNTGERIEVEEEDRKGNCFVYCEDDVLFARLRPYLNKVYRAEKGGVCSTEFHVIRVRRDETGRPHLIPDYLAAVLRSSVVLAQTRHMMTGNTHPRLANDDVVNLVVPLPEREVQEAVAAEVHKRRIIARRLREEAARLWKEARKQFEEALLWPGNIADDSNSEETSDGVVQ